MPYIRLAGVLFDVEMCRPTIFNFAGKHDLLDGSFKQDIYGTKRRWHIGCMEVGWTASDASTLRGLFLTHAEMGFIDLEGGAYTVVFEDDDFTLEPRADIPWDNRRYKGEFTLRQV